jgi:hypothetical protein
MDFDEDRTNPSILEVETAVSKPTCRYLPCEAHGGPRSYYLGRQHAGMVVVDVLIAFVVLVILIGLWSLISRRYVLYSTLLAGPFF